MAPTGVTTDGAAADPPALAVVLPGAAHETGKRVQRRSERGHQHPKGRLRPMRGFETLAGARVLCRAHAFRRDLRGRCYDFGRAVDTAASPSASPVARGWDAPTADLLGR